MVMFKKIKNRLFRSREKNINYNIAKQILETNNDAVLLDVRTKDEYNTKHLKRAINIPLQDITDNVERIIKNKNLIVIVYCQMGGRSLKAIKKMEKMGYKELYNIQGGIESIK